MRFSFRREGLISVVAAPCRRQQQKIPTKSNFDARGGARESLCELELRACPQLSQIMLTRRLFVFAAPLLTAGCAEFPAPFAKMASPRRGIDPSDKARYGAITDERFPVPAIDLSEIDPKYLRQEVAYATPEQAGTLIVDPANYFLYLVMPEGKAMRYGVGVGREGFGWSGSATIKRKAGWPTWTPPAEMIARDRRAAPWAKGMPGGPKNPLGARAMYLYQGERDTLYRIHGTVEPGSIGQSMSSGCIRLLNQDIIDLHGRVPLGTRAVVLPAPKARSADAFETNAYHS
jgi:lipoprotein-anchoring transpeptidase ErfK/SrfK